MRVHHIALRSADVESLAAFYRELLGLAECRDARPRSVWLRLGPDAVLMIEARPDGEPAPDPASMELVALAAEPELREAIRRRAEAAECFDGATEHTLYLRDPEGRRVGISSYPL